VVGLGGDEWYTNRDLFEMVQGLKEDMQKTRDMIRRYNGLYELVHEHDCYIKEQLGKGKGRKSVESAIITWGGWLAAVGSIIYTVLRLAGKI